MLQLLLLLLRFPVRSFFSFHSAVGGRRLKRKMGLSSLSSAAGDGRGAAALHTMAEKAICRKDLRLGLSLLTRQDLMAEADEGWADGTDGRRRGGSRGAASGSSIVDCWWRSDPRRLLLSIDDDWRWALIGRTTATFL